MFIRWKAAVPEGLGAKRSEARERSGPRKGRIEEEKRESADSPKKNLKIIHVTKMDFRIAHLPRRLFATTHGVTQGELSGFILER